MEVDANQETKSEVFGGECEFTVGDFIGSGTFGMVYKGEITVRNDYGGQGDNVAVKIVDCGDKDEVSVEMRQRFQTLVRLKHENLAVYHKIIIKTIQGKTSIELVMDYYTGGDLGTKLSNLKENKILLEKPIALRYAEEITKGISFLHHCHIIHGDLKPANILFKQANNGLESLVIGDLDDLVKLHTSITTSFDLSNLLNICGTLRYMSPEMLQKYMLRPERAPEPGRKTDIWSLGCVIHDLLDRVIGNEERWLQREEEKMEAGDKIGERPYVIALGDGFLPCVSELAPLDLMEIVCRCLNPLPAARSSALEVLCLLQDAKETLAV
ncbi:probable serine/threonine-protein kinase fhkD [Paramacrobiotus metropolitanus]|uniref:probable serine/threonine-protein kinase fhkD n=1 Tax=Paramacrobiotus metropolitanus TaxID=2943436 RepID=UPI0024456B46|nr:probable serine/threonine-protein kinase fhkD [Paramacrobiotus metropolitanus]